MDTQPTKGKGQKTMSLALFEDWKQVKDPYNLPWKHFTRWMWMRLKSTHPTITYAQAMKRAQRVWKNQMEEPTGGWGADIITEPPASWERILADVMTNKSKTKTNAGLLLQDEALPPMPDESVGGFGSEIAASEALPTQQERTNLIKRNKAVEAMTGKNPKIAAAVVKAMPYKKPTETEASYQKRLTDFFQSDSPLGPAYSKQESVYRGEYEMPSEFEARGGEGVPPINFKNPGGFYAKRPMRDEGESIEAFESRKRAFQLSGRQAGESDKDYVNRILAKQTALVEAIGGTKKGGARKGEKKVLFPKKEGESDNAFILRYEAMKASGGREFAVNPGIVHYWGAFFGKDTDEDWVNIANRKVKEVRERVQGGHQGLVDWFVSEVPYVKSETFEEQMKKPLKVMNIAGQPKILPYGNIPKERYNKDNPLDISDPKEFKEEMAKLGLAPSRKVPNIELPDAKRVVNVLKEWLPEEVVEDMLETIKEDQDTDFYELMDEDYNRESYLKDRIVFPIPITKQKGRAPGISDEEADNLRQAVEDEYQQREDFQSDKNVHVARFIQDYLMPEIERKIEEEEDEEFSDNMKGLLGELESLLAKAQYWESWFRQETPPEFYQRLEERQLRRVVNAKEEFKGDKQEELKQKVAELKKELGGTTDLPAVMAPKKPEPKEETKAKFYERMNEFLARTEMEAEDKPKQQGKMMGGSKVPPWGKKEAPAYTKESSGPAYVSSRMGAKTAAGTQLEKGLVEPPPLHGEKSGANLAPIQVNGEDFPREQEIALTLKSSETYKHGAKDKALFPTRGDEKHTDRALLPDKIRGVPFENDRTKLALFAYNPPRKVGEAVLSGEGTHVITQIDRQFLPSAKGLTLERDERKRGRPERDVEQRILTINQEIKELFGAFTLLPPRVKAEMRSLNTTELWRRGGYSIQDNRRADFADPTTEKSLAEEDFADLMTRQMPRATQGTERFYALDKQGFRAYYKLSFRLTDLVKERYMLEVYGKRYLSHAPKEREKDYYGRPEPYYGGMARGGGGKLQPDDDEHHFVGFGPYGKTDKTEFLRPDLEKKVEEAKKKKDKPYPT